MVIVTVLILKDTHVEKYYCGYSGNYHDLLKEFDVRIPVWLVLAIIILGFIPILNIILYLAFYIYYMIHVFWNPKRLDGEVHVYSLKGNNIATKLIKNIWKILNKPV